MQQEKNNLRHTEEFDLINNDFFSETIESHRQWNDIQCAKEKKLPTKNYISNKTILQ